MRKICVLDLETTGRNEYNHAIHQFSGEIYVDKQLEEVFDFRMRPFGGDDICLDALDLCNMTLEELLALPEPKGVWAEICEMLRKYVDPFDTRDKFLSVGFGNSFFDMKFLPRHAKKCGDDFFWTYFHKHPVDLYFDAVAWLAQLGVLQDMPNMKLATVYKTAFGEEMENPHEAKCDVKAARRLCNFLRPGLLQNASES